MSNEITYAVIKNNANIFLKYELWAKGEMSFPNSQGYLEKRQAARKLKAYRTEEAAQDAVTYAKELKQFRGDL